MIIDINIYFHTHIHTHTHIYIYNHTFFTDYCVDECAFSKWQEYNFLWPPAVRKWKKLLTRKCGRDILWLQRMTYKENKKVQQSESRKGSDRKYKKTLCLHISRNYKECTISSIKTPVQTDKQTVLMMSVASYYSFYWEGWCFHQVN